MLTREMFILPELMLTQISAGVLDTPDKVRDAGREYIKRVNPEIEQLREAWRRGMENYAKNPVRFAA